MGISLPNITSWSRLIWLGALQANLLRPEKFFLVPTYPGHDGLRRMAGKAAWKPIQHLLCRIGCQADHSKVPVIHLALVAATVLDGNVRGMAGSLCSAIPLLPKSAVTEAVARRKRLERRRPPSIQSCSATTLCPAFHLRRTSGSPPKERVATEAGDEC